MSNNRSQRNNPQKVLVLTPDAARRICEKHGYRKAAQEVVDALPSRANLKSAEIAGIAEIAELVQCQIQHFEQSLIRCIEGANERASKFQELPERAAQGTALREIRALLEDLRDAIERNWDLAGPLLEIATTEQLDRLLTPEATAELLPPDLRSEYIKASGDKAAYIQQQLKRSFLLHAGSRPLTRLIKGAKIAVRSAEKRISPGAPLKAPLEIALLLELADHFERGLLKKASWTAGGPFSRFCADVFEKLGLVSQYSLEHLLREGLKHYRSSFGARRRHERHDNPKDDVLGSKIPKPRKKKLAPKEKKN